MRRLLLVRTWVIIGGAPFSIRLPQRKVTMKTAIALLVPALSLLSAYGGEPIHLGNTIGTLQFVERTDYEQKELGYSLRYQTKDLLKADVYVYDLGIRNLADGIASPEVRKEMQSVKNILRKMEEAGKYQQVTELASGVRKFEDLKTRFLWARYSYQQSAGERVAFTGTRVSDTFLLVHRGKFLKIRITTKQTDLSRDDPEIERFVRDVAVQIEKGEPGGPTKGSKLIRSVTNQTSSAAASRR